MPVVDRNHPEAGFVELEPVVVVGLDFVVIVAGAVAVAILFAFWLVLYVLNAILGGVSIFGFHPFSFALDLVKAGMNKAVGLLDSKASALGELIFGVVQTLWRFVYVATVTIVGLSWRELAHNQQSQAALASEKARAQFIEGQLRDDYNQQINSLRASTDQAIAGMQQQEGQDFGRLQSTLAGDFTYLQGQVNRLQVEINGLNVPDLSGLQTQINHIQTDLTNAINSLNTTINTTIPNDVADLTTKINAGVQTSENFATGLVSGLGIGGIVQTLTSLSGQVSKITTETAECLDPLCNTVTPNAKRLGHLGDLLKGLEDLGIEAILIALAAECLTDPGAVVNDISTVVHDVGDPVMTGFRDLIGA